MLDTLGSLIKEWSQSRVQRIESTLGEIRSSFDDKSNNILFITTVLYWNGITQMTILNHYLHLSDLQDNLSTMMDDAIKQGTDRLDHIHRAEKTMVDQKKMLTDVGVALLSV